MVPWPDEQREAFLRSQFAAQQADYKERYADAHHSIILADEVSAGITRVLENDSEIKIIDLIVNPEFRRRGIATYFLNNYCARARSANKRVRVYVESFNPSLSLFERLGFARVSDEGVYLLMEWKASSQTNPSEPTHS